MPIAQAGSLWDSPIVVLVCAGELDLDTAGSRPYCLAYSDECPFVAPYRPHFGANTRLPAWSPFFLA